MDAVLQINHLTHCFGEHQVINDLSFQVNQGEVFGLLGPNGAGKTTSIRLINGLYPPRSGNIRVLGLDPVKEGHLIRRLTGVLTENPALYERLSARQNLHFFGEMHDMPAVLLRQRIDEMLSFFELDTRSTEPVSSYSKGMKQRLALARALLTRPPLLFLDEPTSGLDPEAARQVQDIIENVCRQNGQTVILCTHHLFEAERLCNRVAIINQGRLLACGSLNELYSLSDKGLHVEINLWKSDIESAQKVLLPLLSMTQMTVKSSSQLDITVARPEQIPQIISALSAANIQIYSVIPLQPSLEKVYFDLQDQSNRGVL
ncbi:MAG: ABC transporter ATP-binding protein [Anaerolineae bacterium]|nr:ABC transporter ATP-binding protein [Anaerolineae bacterium]